MGGRQVIRRKRTTYDFAPGTEWVAVINWGWVRHRLRMVTCRHVWKVGSASDQRQACRKCGTWRWYLVSEKIVESSFDRELRRMRTRR